MLGYSIGENGNLTALKNSPFVSPGESPADLAVSENDDILFVGHGTDATVRSFSIDSTGALTSTGNSYDVGLQGTIGDVAVMDDLLLVTDDSSALDDTTGLSVFQIYPDGSFDQIGDVLDPEGGRPQKIVVWTPEASCPSDIAGGDGQVNVNDLLELLSNWGTSGNGAAISAPSDIVDVNDLLELLADWGPCAS